MPLSRSIKNNIRELMKDNQKKGKERGAGGKQRSKKQIIAIALNASNRAKRG